MGKRHTFESILEAPFRWPIKSDMLIKHSADPEVTAHISKNPHTRFVQMINGYQYASDILVDSAISEPSKLDSLIYPIIFNYRHFIELHLKYLISNFGRHVRVEPVWNSHDLSKIWLSFIEMLAIFGNEDPDFADDVVGELITEFSKLDPNSFHARYPVDTKGNPVKINLSEIDLKNLKDVMTGVAGYFAGCDGYLDNLVSCGS